MNRRTFLSTVTAGLLGAPLAAEAAIAVGDVPGHQVRIFEIRAKYTNDAPVYAGVKVVEGWTRALSDYTNGSGRSSGYGISTLENGDKIFSSFETLLHTFVDADGSRKSSLYDRDNPYGRHREVQHHPGDLAGGGKYRL